MVIVLNLEAEMVRKLYCKAIFCYRSVIYKRSQITIRSNV